MFDEFIGQNIKVVYRDNGAFRIAKGTLDEDNGFFLKVRGRLGIIIINHKCIERVGKLKERGN